jgi:hypothetical protein
MFRKLIFGAALATATCVGLAPSTAEARPPAVRGGHARGHNDHRARFEVLVLHGRHWDSQGKYRDRDDAERAARHLRQRGFKVRIDAC